MNILFLGLSSIDSFDNRGIYPDLLRSLIKKGEVVFSVTSIERRKGISTCLSKAGDNRLLLVKTFNIQKTNLLEKGLGTLAIKRQYIRAINKFFKGIKFDLILYPTPPITLCGVVEYYKKRDKAKTYLMLKDIFPQNAVDIGLMRTSGIKGLLYKYFRKKEKKLYYVSDKIGCMSQANVDYLLTNNLDIKPTDVEIFPNCIEVKDVALSLEERSFVRNNYNIPEDKIVFVYGGNLGKPQGIPFIIECLRAEANNRDVFFLIIGDGTEFEVLEEYSKDSGQKNFKLIKQLPSDEFDKVLAACDVGLIFLDHRFTIPNFPSRLLSYMQAGLPVLACTDAATDIGKYVLKAGFGWWCESNDVRAFSSLVEKIINSPISEMGEKAKKEVSTQFDVGKIAYERFLL